MKGRSSPDRSSPARACGRRSWRSRFGIEFGEIAADFAARDAVLSAHSGFDRIELWFEHDLYDQLQLVQVLAFFC